MIYGYLLIPSANTDASIFLNAILLSDTYYSSVAQIKSLNTLTSPIVKMNFTQMSNGGRNAVLNVTFTKQFVNGAIINDIISDDMLTAVACAIRKVLRIKTT